jgi:predicted ester cyclase
MIHSLASTDVVTQWISAVGTGDRDALGRLCAADVVVHAPATGDKALAGLDGALAPWLLYRSAFPDGQVRIEHVSVDGPLTECRWIAIGVNRGPFLHLPPTNREIIARGVCRFREANGVIVEHWVTVNVYEILEQLGALASEPGCGDGAAEAVADQALRVWTDALHGRSTADADRVFDRAVVVHADCFGSRSTSRGFAAVGAVVDVIRAGLFDIDTCVNDRVSQGRTVTYRGELSAKSAYTGEPSTYRTYWMFETRSRAVAACWVRLTRGRCHHRSSK